MNNLVKIISCALLIFIILTSVIEMFVFAKDIETNNMLPEVTTSTSIPFVDVHPKNWYYDSVVYCYENSVFSGTSDTTFEPNLRMTRAMFVRTLANISKVNLASYTDNIFKDVNPDSWYAAPISWAVKYNIVSGMGNGYFAPTKAISREQMATILYRYASFNGIDVSCSDKKFSEFVDKKSVSDWAKEAMIWMTDQGFISGMGTDSSPLLAPKDTCTRAQAARVLMLYMEKYPLPEPLPPIDLPELRIAYSSISLCPANSLEHFITAAKLGFNVIKCDIRPTKDGELICCHDAGYTLKETDGEMMIANAFDANDCVLISDMTAEECLSLKFKWRRYNNGLGHTARPCTLSEYLDVCNDYGLIPFITIRNEQMDVVIPRLLEIIEEKGVHDKCIINSMTFDSLQMVREKDPTIRLNYVTAKTTPITTFHVKRALSIGCTLSGFNYTSTSAPPDYDQMQEALDMAKENGLTMYQSVIYTQEQWEEAKKYGFVGAQVAMPIFDYDPFSESFKIIVEDGVPRFENIDGCTRPMKAEVRMGTDRPDVYIKNITYVDTKYEFADAIMPIWMNYLPYTITCVDKNGDAVEAVWNDVSAAIEIKGDTDGEYTFTVTIGESDE